MSVPFVDLRAQHKSLSGQIEQAMLQVARETDFILGKSVADLESEFAAYCGVRHAIGVDSGISALELILRAHGIGAGDEVITVSHTFIATASSISFTGATPVFVDVSPTTYLIDVDRIEAAITPRTRAIMVVHIYGQPADMERLMQLAEQHQLLVIEDAAQAHGARYGNRRVGTFGVAAAFSFYPAKNLGAYGDGGMVVTDSDSVAEHIRMIRNYGQRKKYDHQMLAYNRRLDTLQAAILRVKLAHLDRWNALRRDIAARYGARLATHSRIVLPVEAPDREHVYHLFVIQHPERDALMTHLTECGVSTGLHYPIPVHKQQCYADLLPSSQPLPVTEALASRILSLPMYPEMSHAQVDCVCDAIDEFERKRG